jgi:preprotein translocase subunit SecD
MKTNIKTRLIVIVAVLVVFIFGIFRVPHGVSGSALKKAILQNIHLGLDLKGGMHLILQVKVDEAVSAQTDTDVASIQGDLQRNGIAGAVVSKPDPNRADFIQVSGVPADHANDVRSLLESSYSSRFDVAPGVGNTWTLTMKATIESDAKQRALEQAIEVIQSRTNTLGVSEPIIEPYQLGSYQILVELPGVASRTSSSPPPASKPMKSSASGPISRPRCRPLVARFLLTLSCCPASPAHPAQAALSSGMSSKEFPSGVEPISAMLSQAPIPTLASLRSTSP